MRQARLRGFHGLANTNIESSLPRPPLVLGVPVGVAEYLLRMRGLAWSYQCSGGTMSIDRIYEPDLSAVTRLVAETGADALLVIGEPNESAVPGWRSVFHDIRFSTSRTAVKLAQQLPNGYYGIRQRRRWTVVAIVDIGVDAIPARARSQYELGNSDPLVTAGDIAEDFWDSANVLTEEDVLVPGTTVLVRGTNDMGQVIGHQRIADTIQYTVEFRGSRRQISSPFLIALPNEAADPALWLELPPASSREIGLTVAWTKLHNPLTDVIYSFGTSRTVFRPYQFKPVLKIMQGEDHRLLIADEVGLGKTIEAGLILSELDSRSPLDRVLVLCPAALTIKWQTEMQLRFDRKLNLLGRHDWDEFLRKSESGQQAPLFGVDSIERLRMTDVPERLVQSGIRFDLVIVDEGHKLRNQGTLTYELGQSLAESSDAFVMLSATPVNLGNKDLFNLLRLLDAGRFTDFSTFQLESEPNAAINQALADLSRPGCSPSSIRRNLLNLADHPIGAAILKRSDMATLLDLLDGQAMDASTTNSAKRILAGLGVFAGYITRTRKIEVPDAKALREAFTLSVTFTQEERDFYDAVRTWARKRAEDLGTPPGFLEQMPLRQTASCIPAMVERMRLGSATADTDYLAEGDVSESDVRSLVPELRVRVPATDSKFAQLLVALTKVREVGLTQVMVFSYFRLTLDYLRQSLQEQGFSVRVMHGGVHIDEREEIMKDFRSGKFEVLLLSEVGSEGLDFEYCGALVNYDLPWNPMKVEQRIGRLDRFGQQHEKILIFNFVINDTIEDRILLKLYERIGVFKRSIGDLEPIVAEELADIGDLMVDLNLSEPERDLRLHQLEIAIEAKESDLQRLRDAEGDLMALDGLLIDGFEQDNPGRGRFIGEGELLAVLGDLLARTDGELREVRSDGHVVIVGSTQLADSLSKYVRLHQRAVGTLLQQVRDGLPFSLALRPTAAATAQQLLSSKHPLIKVAVDTIQQDPLGLKRFGHVSISSVPTRQYFALLNLLNGHGVRPFLRLEATVVDINGDLTPEIGERLLQCLATGDFGDGKLGVPRAIEQLYFQAEKLAAQSRIEAEKDLHSLTDSMIASRRASLLHSFGVKITAKEAALRDGLDERIRRMHEGGLRNLRANLDMKLAELATVHPMVSSELVALVLIDV